MADKEVGTKIVDWIYNNYKNDISTLVTKTKNELYYKYKKIIKNVFIFNNELELISAVKNTGIKLDYGFLTWWPDIISEKIISIPKNGFLNTHPSLLPFNRGKHYNFWALIEQAPFGVSLHFVEKNIDSGDIIAQKSIPYTWEDNGGTLYEKASLAMVDLFKATYPRVRSGNYERIKQNLDHGSFHLAKELEEASYIDINKHYKASDLLNLLRARTFPGFPGCWFKEDSVKYEIKIEIIRKNSP